MDLGGKRWRPVLLVLCSELCREAKKNAPLSLEQTYSITPLVEFVHTASLIHDDIEDSAETRRGKPAAHITFGLDVALNAGSWLYFVAPETIDSLKVSAEFKLQLYALYTQELRRLHLGQAMDIYWHRNPHLFPSVQEYTQMVHLKTGTLASLAVQTGFLAGGATKEEELNGYKIYTSLKRNISDIIPTTEDYGLDCDYTVIIVDNETKAIRGYASSAGDLRRCPASAAKPWLVYAPALEEKIITEATKINDEKTTFGNYSPKNADGKFHGFVSAKEALSKSSNIPSVKLADSMGTDKIIAYAKKMNVGFDNDDLSVSLGNLSGGITLNQLISCYSCFTNRGNFVEYSAVEKIVNPKGKVVFENKKNQNKVFSDSTAFLINDMLKDAVKNGTAKKLSSFPFEICAKTGTNGDKNGNTDAYCVAYTVRHTVAVWLGNANGKAMSNSVTGGNYPAAIIRDIFSALYKTAYPENFTIPESIVRLNIDKTEYENNQKLLLREKCDKDSLAFYFSKDNSPTEYALKKDSTPIIKDFKINCKNNEISIFITTDKGTGFYIADENENIVYKSNQGGEYKFSATEKEYNLFAIPFLTDENGKEIKGEKIKLPVIKPESGKKKITDTPWWEE